MDINDLEKILEQFHQRLQILEKDYEERNPVIFCDSEEEKCQMLNTIFELASRVHHT